jgi:hypothetical protein
MSEGGLIRIIDDILCENVSRIVLYGTAQVWKLAMRTLLDAFLKNTYILKILGSLICGL